MDGGAWKAAVHGVARGRTRLSDFTFTFHFHALEKEMATHSNVLAWRIPGTGESGRLPSMGSHRVGHDWSDLAAAAFLSDRGLTRTGTMSNIFPLIELRAPNKWWWNEEIKHKSRNYLEILTRVQFQLIWKLSYYFLKVIVLISFICFNMTMVPSHVNISH